MPPLYHYQLDVGEPPSVYHFASPAALDWCDVVRLARESVTTNELDELLDVLEAQNPGLTCLMHGDITEVELW